MGQNKIRLSLTNPKTTQELRLLYVDGAIFRYRKMDRGFLSLEISDEEAASDLFDLLALTPDFHFSRDEGDQFDLNIPIFENYRFVLNRVPVRKGGRSFRPPLSAELYRIDPETKQTTLVRSALYGKLDAFGNTLKEPARIRMTDAKSDEATLVEIKSVDYNPGLTSFFFARPKTSSDL